MGAKDQNSDHLYAMRHSAAHVLATAVQHLWPEAKFGVGPVVEHGFYYDIDLGKKKLSEEDFKQIEGEMHKIINTNQKFEKSMMPIDKAIDWAKKAKQPYKLELLNDLMREGTTLAKELDISMMGLPAGITGGSQAKAKIGDVSFYTNGDFTDLCRGPHVDSTGKIGPFKLMRVSGAYWRGDEKNAQMQRVYGVAFKTKEELANHLKMLEEAKARDHRKLGQELDLFTFSDLIGSGLPLWTPKGTILRRQLDNFVQELRDQYDYTEVTSTHITRKEAYIASGHWKKFADELFKIKTREGHEFAMKPMSCPHHTQIYARRPHSYRELPVRYRETTMVYRDEQSGELSGLSRVRSITQDDAHVFCRSSQIKDEVEKIWDIIETFYGAFDFPLKIHLSRHDPANKEAYLGTEKQWQEAEAQLEAIVKSRVGKDFEDDIGEAAFYGPKIDFISHDSLGREHQVATIQLDFNQPEGFDLVCINEKGDRERVVMIHAAIMGSIERLLSVLIEHLAGKFPVWLAPEQIRIITLNQEAKTVKFAEEVLDQAKDLGLRVVLDNDKESVGKKIRNAELMKVPYSVVIGDKEIESGKVVPRVRSDFVVQERKEPLGIEDFLKSVSHESKSRGSKSSI